MRLRPLLPTLLMVLAPLWMEAQPAIPTGPDASSKNPSLDYRPMSESEFRTRLSGFLARYEEASRGGDLPYRELQGQGYHTMIPNGTFVRSTRDAMDYALGLFADGSADNVARAVRIVREVIAHQDIEPGNPTFGLWPYYFEEPLTAMRPPDWNWADFIGVRLAHVLGQYGDATPADLQDGIRQALSNAAFSIFRRNMGPEYTNIAVKGGVAAIMAGELTNQPLLLRYGRERLARFLAYTSRNGGFNEYNSPPYGTLVLLEVERGLLLIKDPEARASLAAIHELCWRSMAQSLHLPTGQLSGPHARAYDNTLSPTQTELLGRELGVPLFSPSGQLPPYERGRDVINLLIIPRRPCPDDIRQQILTARPHRLVHQDYVRSEIPDASRRGTMWFDGDACLGSINVENTWQQRRPVLAYWKTGDTVAVLRVRFKQGGQDFASGMLRTEQAGPALISHCSLVTNKGFSHDHLDRPADGVFRVSDLALSIELAAPGAQVRHDPATGAFTLTAGDRSASIIPLQAEFGPHRLAWTTVQTDGVASIRAVIADGAPLEFDPRTIGNVGIGFTLVLHDPAQPTTLPGTAEVSEDRVTLSADTPDGRLSLTVPRQPIEYR